MQEKPLRREPRTAAVLPVRIYGMNAEDKPFNSMAHTLNVSKSGALLANVDVALNIGDVIGVQKGVYKCKFRVMWIGKKGSTAQGQIGIESVEGPKNIWGAEERPHSMVREFDAANRRSFVGNGPDHDRRVAPRYACDIGVQVGQPGSDMKLWSRCTDISEGGCYIDTNNPLAVSTNFQLTLFLGDDNLVMPAEVRTSFPGIGMGIRFLFESKDDEVTLRRFLRKKFGAPGNVSEEAETREFVALEKLAECVEQFKAWAINAELDDDEREQLEEFAASLRGELQGLRAELNHRRMLRTAEKPKVLAAAGQSY